MSDTDTPTPKDLARDSKTDKFQLAILVTRLEAQIQRLIQQVDCLNESDENQDDKIRAIEKDQAALVKQVAELTTNIKEWRLAAEAADQNHASRLKAIERRINGFGSLLVLLQFAFEAWKAAHGQ